MNDFTKCPKVQGLYKCEYFCKAIYTYKMYMPYQSQFVVITFDTVAITLPVHPSPFSPVVLPLLLSRWPFLSTNPHQKALITAAAPPASCDPIINTANWLADRPVRHRSFTCNSELSLRVVTRALIYMQQHDAVMVISLEEFTRKKKAGKDFKVEQLGLATMGIEK